MKKFLISLLLLCSGAALDADDNFINILSLGAKNDGSQDISAIFNANTHRGPIFFPAGLYRVDSPLIVKNPVRGEGYSRDSAPDSSKTWLISNIDCRSASASVLEYAQVGGINIENLNIKCFSSEDGIRIMNCSQRTMSLISHVGIFSVGNSCGIRIVGGGSRPVFIEDVTIFGKGASWESTGLLITPFDCRLTNIEIMGTQTGVVLKGGYTYGSNLHVWTGVMGEDKDGSWWKKTRAFVLYDGGIFVGSQIYPDTSYIVFEQKAGSYGGFDISEILYYDDGSQRNTADRGGMFFYADPQAAANLNIRGGIVGVCGTDDNPFWMSRLYTPGENIEGVLVRTDRKMCGENIDLLCISDALVDYSLDYADKGWCKVADIFDMAPTGHVSADISIDDGALWSVDVLKDEKGRIKVKYKSRSSLCRKYSLMHKQEDSLVRLYVLSPDDRAMTVRFTTRAMNRYFRPADYSSLRAHDFSPRYREVIR